MSWLSCERRSVSPWRLTIPWISLDEQRRTNSPSSWAALACGIPNTPASPSSHARICRSTLHLISSLHPMHHACKNQLAAPPLEWLMESHQHSHCSFLQNGVFFAAAVPSLAFGPTGCGRLPARVRGNNRRATALARGAAVAPSPAVAR